MPITKSAKKKLKQDKKRQKKNLKVLNSAKKFIKDFQKNPSRKLLNLAFKALDHTRKKRIFHANKVARLKSKLALTLNKKPAQKTNKTKASIKPKASKKKAKINQI